MSTEPVLVGAVSYHPRVVTVWEKFLEHFAARGVPTDYVLYSNYERLIDAFLQGDVDIAWNTNTAYVVARHRVGAELRVLAMRDLDANFATVIVARRDGGEIGGARDLAGRRLALGSRDSGHAAILPLHYLRREDVDAAEDCELVRFDTDLGKHGDTGDSELHVVRAVSEGRADAGAVGDATWARMRTEGVPETAGLEVVWRSPSYYHCNFTALAGFDGEVAEGWCDALLAMDYDDPQMRHAMDLEGVKRWLPGDEEGYRELEAAMSEQGYLR